MAKGGNSLSSKRSRNAKPYDANNSFVKKVATKVTDLIPQRSWISKWFNSSQDNGEMVNDTDNPEDSENEEELTQPPPTKRPRIRMDVTHPPGTFNIQPRSRPLVDEVDPRKDQYIVHNETTADFLEPPVAGTSGIRRLVASTPAIQSEVRTTNTQRNRAEFTPLTTAQNNGAANGTDDNSESSESTSGCSSLIPQVNRQEAPSSLGYNRSFASRKRYGDDKLNFTNHLQSPRSLFLDSHPRDSLSSRRPSFNASLINNSLERGPSYSSPFYNGNTTFGGANTAGFQRRGRTLFNSTNEIQLKVPNRTNIQVKSPGAAGTDSSGMSQTAKRILEALEHFSSPILDAKKIPMNANSNSSPIGGKKRQRDETGVPLARVGLRHLTRELTVPTVPDLLKLRRRQRLQDTTVAARKIVSARSAPPPSPQEYRLRSADDEKSTKYSGKVKAKDKTEFEEDFMAETVNLPSIALPISTLPTFDIMLPAKKSSSGVVRGGAKEELFKFASPIKVTDTSRNLKSINNFTFSKPINANDKDSDDSYTLSKTLTVESDALTFSSSSSTTTASNFIWSNTSTAPKLKEKFKDKDSVVDGVKMFDSLKSGSVMDILGKKSDPLMDAWKPAVGMWECSQCLIRNAKDEIQCVACKASKFLPKVEKSSESSSASSTVALTQSKPIIADCFGSQFKMSSNQWECDACMVRNKQTDIKCVSCTTPRPGSVKTPSFGSTSDFSTFGKSSDLMEKFKPAEGSWECPGCLLRNPGNVETCPCCNDSKPGSLKISPKKVPANLVSFTPNTEKSKTADTLDSSSSSLKKSDSSGFGDKFKKPEGAWTCDDCMLQNKGDATECIACCAAKPGAKKTAKPGITPGGSTVQFNFEMPKDAGSFKFGIDKSDEKAAEPASKSDTPATGFTFGSKLEAPKTGGFTFGVPQNSTGFTFGVPDTNKSKSPATNETKEKTATEPVSKKRSLNTDEEPKNPPAFSFGVPKTEEAKSAGGKQFAFGTTMPAATTEPSFSFGSIKTGSVTQEKTNEIPKISFGVPSSMESPKLNFSSTTTEKPATTLASDYTNLHTTKSFNTTDAKTISQLPAYGTTHVPVTISASTINKTTASAPPPGYSTFETTTTVPSQSNTLPTQSFGQNLPAPAPLAPGSGMFLFGSNKPANTTTTAPPAEKSPALSFGGTNSSTNFSSTNSTPLFSAEGSENKTIPAFGVPENKAPPPFGTTENKAAPIFGAQDSKIMAFENPAKKPAPAFNPPAPSFGVSSSASPAFGSTTLAFGNAATNPFEANSTPNMFAAPKLASKPVAPALFTFGGSNPPEPSSGFNFLANNSAPTPAQAPAQEKLFTFGNTQSNQQTGAGFGGPTNFNASAAPESTPGSFTFNAPPKPDPPAFGQTAPIATPMFGAPQSTPSFGQSQPTPAFGSAAPAPNPGGFNFGGAAPVAPSGFNFGGQPPATASTGGFALNAPNPNPSISFDPNTPPTFNFTGGSTLSGFNATPQAAHSRKIKKAVRRTQPR